jgi:hypothetical protein
MGAPFRAASTSKIRYFASLGPVIARRKSPAGVEKFEQRAASSTSANSIQSGGGKQRCGKRSDAPLLSHGKGWSAGVERNEWRAIPPTSAII